MSYRVPPSKRKERRARPGTESAERLQEKKQKAFRAWLDASNAWSALARRVAGGDDPSSGTRRKLQKLEARVEAAAEALERLLSHPRGVQDLRALTPRRRAGDALQAARSD